jgi:hypothetical protein
MAGIFAFRCAQCGELHEGSPSFAVAAPMHYEQLDAAQRAAMATLTADTCEIRHPDHVDRFVRVCLEIPIHGVDEPFVWGVWVTLSEANYARYLSLRDAPADGEAWFGWFSTYLPVYPDTINLKTRVHPRGGGLRPWLELEATDHPLSVHAREGLSIAEAQAIAEAVLHGGEA